MEKATTYYLIVITEEGNLVSYTELPETLPEIERTATVNDIYLTSRQITEDFDREMLAAKVLQGVAQMLTPPKEETVPEKVSEALKKRKTESETVSEQE
jgi:hypothetical protein